MKGSRNSSEKLESSSYRTFKEQLRQIQVTDEINTCLILTCVRINILPAPYPWVKKGPFPSFALMPKNSISAIGREPCKPKWRNQKDMTWLNTVKSQEGAVTLRGWLKAGFRGNRGASAALNQTVHSQDFKVPFVSIFWLALDSCMLSTGKRDPSSLSMFWILL